MTRADDFNRSLNRTGTTTAPVVSRADNFTQSLQRAGTITPATQPTQTFQPISTSQPTQFSFKDKVKSSFNQIKNYFADYIKKDTETKNKITERVLFGKKQEVQPVEQGPKNEVLKPAPKPTFWSKLTDSLKQTFGEDTLTQKSLAMNAYAVQKVAGEKEVGGVKIKDIPLTELAKQGGNMLKNSVMEDVSKQIGLRKGGTNSEVVATAFTVAAGVGLIEAPVSLLVGLGTFEAVNKIRSNMVALVTGKPLSLSSNYTLSDLAPNAPSTVKNMLDIIDIIGTGMAVTKVHERYPQLVEKITKDTLVKYNMPKSVKLDSSTVGDIVNGLSTKEQKDLFTSLHLSNDEIVKIVREGKGVTIDVPAEKVVSLVDKPYWIKVKKIFGKSPSEPINLVFPSGDNVMSQTIAGYLTDGQHTPAEVIGKVMDSGSEKTAEGKTIIKKAVEAQGQGGNITVEKVAPKTKKVDEVAAYVEKKGVKLRVQPKTFYRGGTEPSMPRNSTAQDIINYERTYLKNKDVIPEPGVNPSEVSAHNLMWLTEKAADAKEYGKVTKVPLNNYRIIARDGFGGVLVDTNPVKNVPQGGISDAKQGVGEIQKKGNEKAMVWGADWLGVNAKGQQEAMGLRHIEGRDVWAVRPAAATWIKKNIEQGIDRVIIVANKSAKGLDTNPEFHKFVQNDIIKTLGDKGKKIVERAVKRFPKDGFRATARAVSDAKGKSMEDYRNLASESEGFLNAGKATYTARVAKLKKDYAHPSYPVKVYLSDVKELQTKVPVEKISPGVKYPDLRVRSNNLVVGTEKAPLSPEAKTALESAKPLDEIKKSVQVGITSAAVKVPELNKLGEEASAARAKGDFETAQKIDKKILDVGEPLLKNLFKDRKGVEISVERTFGDYYGVEPTFKTTVTFPKTEEGTVVRRLASLGEKLSQDTIHVSDILENPPESAQLSKVFADGYSIEPQMSVTFDRAVTPKESNAFMELLHQYGFAGATKNVDGKGFYWYNISRGQYGTKASKFLKQSEKLIGDFNSGRLQQSLGKGSSKIRITGAERSYRRLLVIGNPEGGATRTYDQIRSYVSPAERKPEKPESFRIKEDLKKVGIKITDQQEKEIIKLNRKLFGDTNVKVTGQIISNYKALGSYEDNIIKILKGQANPKDTLYHEAVHKYLDVFTDKNEYIEILKEGRLKYKIQDLAQVEEKLAEDFIKFAKNKEGFTGKIRAFFAKILNRIKKYFGSKDRIEQLYNDIISGKAAKRPVESGVARQIEAKAIEKGMVDKGYNELAQYDSSTIKEQAKLASKYTIEDINKIATGEKTLPKELKPGTPLSIAEDYAIKNGDSELLRKLANSPLATQISESASELSLSRMRNNDSPVKKMKEISDTRKSAFERRIGKKADIAVKDEVNKIKSKIKAPDKYDWNQFIDSIETC